MKLSESDLLELKRDCSPSVLTGAGRAYTLALRIPQLVDEILSLRREAARLSEKVALEYQKRMELYNRSGL